MVVAVARKVPTQARAKATVEAILQASAQVLEADGYEGFTTNKVAARAGCSIGSLYQYFQSKEDRPSKEALVIAVAERHHEEIFERLQLIATQGQGDRVEDLARALVRGTVEAHALTPRLHRVITEEVPRAIITRCLEDDIITFVEVLIRARRAELRPGLDEDHAAYLLVHAIEGAVHNRVLNCPGEDHSRFADELATMALRYLLP